MDQSQKTIHEQFMQNHKGTTPQETLWVILPSGVTFMLLNCFAVLATRVIKSQTILVEFIIAVFPLVLNSTVLSEYILLNLIPLTLFTFLIFILIVLTSPIHDFLTWDRVISAVDLKTLITNFRGIVNLITAICILAVDFHSFPRRFAKTEFFGWGVMDTGVGLFVVANGLVDPAVRGIQTSLRSTLKGCIPVLFLGFVRWFTVWMVQYHEHVTEYGVHWNFFITLAFTRLISTSLLNVYFKPRVLALLTIVVHQTCLFLGTANWIIDDGPRDNMFNANKEGIGSLLGYVALHLLSICLGKWIQDNHRGDQAKKLVPHLAIFAIIMWLLALQTRPPSRRMTNISYIAWILGYGATILVLFLVVHIGSIALGIVTRTHLYSPVLLAAINYNGLVFFLLANLLTGVINMSVNTLLVAPAGSVIVITTYMYLLCFTISRLYVNKIKLKFW